MTSLAIDVKFKFRAENEDREHLRTHKKARIDEDASS